MTGSGIRGRAIRRLFVAMMAAALVTAPSSAAAAEEYHFDAIVFDIAAAPGGGILVADAYGGTIHEIRRGTSAPLASVPLPDTGVFPTGVNGLAAIGRGNFFATTGGGDLAAGAKLWRVSPGGARMVADIEAFEAAHDPDAFAGPRWKDQRCEATGGFSAGPQSNPYHLSALSGGEALVADAAGNTLLSARTDGQIEVVAVFTPPVAGGGASTDPAHWMSLFSLEDGTTCYVQPVPTSVAIGPDGAYYVGELTGATPDLADAPGLSRVWRIAPGARNVTCPSAACQVVLSGLTSVIDVEFGPDGALYVVEWDAAGWLSALFGVGAGGTVQRCDVGAGSCAVMAGGLALPGAIAFDAAGTAWIVENTFSPTVRTLH
ncbi:MAG: ScyD/ScyE family protein [Chloroflexi bacterium]|nr:ScyD/ScyE family protein [Chloroflexota bacterium]